GIGAEHLELPERRTIEAPRALSDRSRLALRGGLQRLTGPRVGGRPAPVAEGLEQRALRGVPVVRRQALQGPVQCAHPPAGENAGRKRVVPTCAGARLVYSPIRMSALMLLVLPWSVPMPVVV